MADADDQAAIDTRRCGRCGCTHTTPCVGEGEHAIPCHWVTEDLCSACVTAEDGRGLQLAAQIIPIPMTGLEWRVMLSGLQCGLSHPGFAASPQGQLAETVATQLISLLVAEEAIAPEELAAMMDGGPAAAAAGGPRVSVPGDPDFQLPPQPPRG